MTQNPNRLARVQDFIAQVIASDVLLPTIDKGFSLDDVVETHQYLESKQQFRKVMMTVD